MDSVEFKDMRRGGPPLLFGWGTFIYSTPKKIFTFNLEKATK